MKLIKTGSGAEHGTAQMMPIAVAPQPLAQMRAYWEGLRVAGAIPARSQIDPRGIADILSRAFLLERIAPGMAQFRIGGMDLAALMGMEARGLPFSNLFGPASRAQLANKIESMFHTPAILIMDLTAERGLVRPALSAQILILPLCDDRGTISMALGCLSIQAKTGRMHRRFDLVGATLTPLVTPQADRHRAKTTSAREQKPVMAQRPAERAFAEAASRFDFGPQSGAHPYLRVVK